MFEQSCSGKSSFSQTLGPAMPEKWPPLLPTLQQCPYKNPYTGSAIMRAKGPQLYSPKSRRRSCHATLCDSAWDGSPQGKELAARRRVDRQHEILFRSYRDQRWWVQRTRSSAISSDHLVLYQDDEQRIWRCCSSTCARPGRTTHPARLALPALPALPPILWQSTITSSHNHCLARKAPPERANWNTLRSNITGI